MRASEPARVETIEVLLRRAVILVGTDIEHRWNPRPRLLEHPRIAALSQLSEHIRGWLLASIGSDDAERSLAYGGGEWRTVEKSLVVVSVTPRVSTRCASGKQTFEHFTVIGRSFFF